MPTIIIATVNRPAGDTGVHTHTRALCEGLAESGLACAVQSPFTGGHGWLPIFAMRRLIRPINPSLSTQWYRHWHAMALRGNLMRDIARHGARAVIAQCPLSADAALDVRQRLGLDFPIAMVCHFNFSEAREYRDKGELGNEAIYQAIIEQERRVLTSVDRVIYVSRWAQRVVEQARGIIPRNSTVIWNGIDPATPLPEVSRQSLGLAEDDLALMNVGTLEPRKDQIGLIDLFAQVAKQFTSARLVLVGDGPQRAEIQRKIEALGLRDKVRLLGHRSEVPALLPAADIYVHHATMENCPVALLEAARAARPIAAARGGGAGELLDALGGTSMQPGDLRSSLAALQPLLADAGVRRSAGANARAAFERSFTREAMAGAYIDAMQLNQLVGDGVRS
ncbi:MAG TPA: glycosyltransferase family 4 protein [Tepidisphaeraceae bacterium]|nr:glycosyltransferase family 4 protein [Tepidisphaeraceae bacterium]